MLVGSLFKPKAGKGFIDYGYHTLNHKPLTYISDTEAKGEIRSIYNAKSFSAPLNLVDDPLKPGRVLKMLKEEGYKIVVWAGPTIRDKNGKVVILPERKKISKPVAAGGIKCVYISNAFNDNFSIKQMEGIINEIKENAKKNAVYCIKTHDFCNKKTTNLEYILRELSKLRDKRIISLKNLRQIVA